MRKRLRGKANDRSALAQMNRGLRMNLAARGTKAGSRARRRLAAASTNDRARSMA